MNATDSSSRFHLTTNSRQIDDTIPSFDRIVPMHRALVKVHLHDLAIRRGKMTRLVGTRADKPREAQRNALCLFAHLTDQKVLCRRMQMGQGQVGRLDFPHLAGNDPNVGLDVGAHNDVGGARLAAQAALAEQGLKVAHLVLAHARAHASNRLVGIRRSVVAGHQI
jgi:hypothetical protein